MDVCVCVSRGETGHALECVSDCEAFLFLLLSVDMLCCSILLTV